MLLPYKEALNHLSDNYPEWESLDNHEKVKVCHRTCTAGEDTRNRMNITRVDNSVLWHCFNCGDSGAIFLGKDKLSRITDKRETIDASLTVDISSILKEYDGGEENIAKWDIDAQLWLSKYDMLDTSPFRLRYLPEIKRIALPIHYGEGSIVGVQHRRLHTTSNAPKYITKIADSGKCHFTVADSSSNCVVVVEDLMSAYKLHKFGYNAIALLGTKLPAKFPTMFTRYILWLDYDAAGHSGTLKLHKELAVVGQVYTIFPAKESKECTKEEINNYLGGLYV